MTSKNSEPLFFKALNKKYPMLRLLLYINWNIDPNLFTVPLIDHPIRWYGLMWVIGLAFSYRVLFRIFTKECQQDGLLDQLTSYMIVGTILGARMGHVLFYDPSYYFEHPLRVFAIWEGGLASHGGGIGILLSLYLFSRVKKINFFWLADRVAIIVPLAGGFIRLGNLMNSEMIGTPSKLPWAFVFHRIDHIPRHPAQLYEAIFCFALFYLLFQTWRKGYFFIKAKGNIFAVLLILLFSFRFIYEFLKVNQEAFEDKLMFNMGQLLSIPFILTGVLILLYNKKLRALKKYQIKNLE